MVVLPGRRLRRGFLRSRLVVVPLLLVVLSLLLLLFLVGLLCKRKRPRRVVVLVTCSSCPLGGLEDGGLGGMLRLVRQEVFLVVGIDTGEIFFPFTKLGGFAASWRVCAAACC